MKVTLHPAAERDIEAAAEFYEREASPLIAARFVKQFRHDRRRPGFGNQRRSPSR